MSLADHINRHAPRPTYTIPERLKHVSRPEPAIAAPVRTYTPPVRRPDPDAEHIARASMREADLQAEIDRLVAETAALRAAINPPHSPSKALAVGIIKRTVAEHFGLTVFELEGPRRARMLAWPRQMAMTLIKENVQMSLPEVGRTFGGRDHTTAMHAIRKTQERMQDADWALAMTCLRSKVFAALKSTAPCGDASDPASPSGCGGSTRK